MNLKNYIIENSAGSLFWKNCKGIYMGCNRNMANIAGLDSPDEIIGKSDSDLYSEPELVKRIVDNDKMVLLSKKEQVFEEIGRDSKGNKAWYLTRKTLLRDKNGEIIGILGTAIDITEQKAAEEREKELLIKEEAARNKANYEEQYRQTVMVLSGSIAHDLRTPIATLGLISSDFKRTLPQLMMAYRKIKEVSPESVQLKDRELDHLTDSVAELQEILSQMNKFIDSTLKMLSQSGKLHLKAKDLMSCSINKCIQQTLSRYPFEEGQRELIQWQLDGKNNFHFMGNEILMVRILFNLLKNALHQIAKHKRGKIIISTEKTTECNILRFRDTAVGVEPEKLKSLFIPYETTEAKGTGIGLAYCQHTMKNFNGQMTCHSKYGEYIEFVMKFPLL